MPIMEQCPYPPAVPPLWLHIGGERPPSPPRGRPVGAAQTVFPHFEAKTHPNDFARRHVTFNHMTVPCCLAVTRQRGCSPSPALCPRRASGAGASRWHREVLDGELRARTGLLSAGVREAVARSIGSVERRRRFPERSQQSRCPTCLGAPFLPALKGAREYQRRLSWADVGKLI